MPGTPVWEVVLYVDGPVTLRDRMVTTQQKGFRVDDPFYSDIEIRSVSSGLKATVTARALNAAVAYRAAVVFFGRMLDALTLTVNRPMHLNLTENQRTPTDRHEVRRVIEHDQVANAFRDAHNWANHRSSFLRALGWYRKGLTTNDPLDRFLAFWNAMEIVASRYYGCVDSIDKERAKGRSKSQVWECFKALWGPCEQWPVIAGRNLWIDESHSVRNAIAHGVAFVGIETVSTVADRLPVMEEISYQFLADWRDQFLDTIGEPPE